MLLHHGRLNPTGKCGKTLSQITEKGDNYMSGNTEPSRVGPTSQEGGMP